MDYERALEKVDQFAKLCEQLIATQAFYPNAYDRDSQWQETQRRMTEQLPLVEKIAEELDPRIALMLRTPDRITMHHNQRDAAFGLRGMILSQEEAADILGPQGPKLAASQLHRWVWDHAAKLWSDGHRRAAVQTAATALFDAHIPGKLARQRDTQG